MKLLSIAAISALISLSVELNNRNLQSEADFCKTWNP